jgi:hypothetical protein
MPECISVLASTKVKELEEEQESGAWSDLAEEPRAEKAQELLQARGMARYHLLQTDKTFQLIGYVSASPEGCEPFLAAAMIDRMAAMLNSFVAQLVGPKMRELKVADMKLVDFDPPALLVRVLRVIANLHANATPAAAASFLEAVVSDGLYTQTLYTKSLGVLTKIQGGAGAALVVQFATFLELHPNAIKAAAEMVRQTHVYQIPDAYQEAQCYLTQRLSGPHRRKCGGPHTSIMHHITHTVLCV